TTYDRKTDSVKPLSPSADVDIVYYFMTSARCPSCMKIEAFTKEAVQNNFTDYLKDGRIEWHIVQVDKPENRHFIKDYQLYTKSVVLVKIRNGEEVNWKNLERVWQLLYDKNDFQAYISQEVKSFIEKG
ncbi:unnamed protein product, partial [marine sediment metagenome]